MDTPKVLWLITARAGSKGIPDKNIKLLGGIPLLAYRIKSALAISNSEDVIVSTDSEKYACISKSFGASVPFLRPSELALDTSKSEGAVSHAIDWAESQGRRYDAIGLLQPTSPFIKASHLLEAANNLFTKDSEAESIVSVRDVKPSSFLVQQDDRYLSVIAERISGLTTARRQDFPKEITPSGGIFIAKWEVYKEKRTFYTDKTLSYSLPDVYGIDIDEPLDFLWAEFLIEKNIVNAAELFSL
jgi:CMP-N,N'-diacetyllegionaminic acid synthase